jgi:hypothetical protein
VGSGVRLVAVVARVHERAPETAAQRQAQQEERGAEDERDAKAVLARLFGAELLRRRTYFAVAHAARR